MTEVYDKVRQVLQSVTEVYYKVRQVLQSVTDGYYKVSQVLQSPFEANEMFCLLNKFVLLTNQKQPLKCARQNSYLNLIYYLTGRSSFSKIKAGGTNK